MNSINLALISDVFFGPRADERLDDRLADAAARGADLALLPEIPLHPWSPATREPRDEDAEELPGARGERLAAAARRHRLGIVGGTIARDPEDGERFSTALVFDARGELVAKTRKVHIPEEPGFWETSHYRGGGDFPRPVPGFAMPLGVQICSDANRPAGTQILAAQGAEAVLVPRSTERATWERWKLVLRANAVTACCYVLSVNRPGPEQGVLIGGPSLAVDPDGAILVETTDPVSTVELSSEAVAAARRRYPGYLPVRASLYAAGWRRAAESARDRGGGLG